MSQNAVLHLTLFGPPQVATDDGPIQITRRQPLALLAILALNDGAVARDRIAFLLWPDVPQANARQNLRRTLSRLRQTLAKANMAEAVQVLGRDQVALNHEQCQIDVRDFTHQAEEALRNEGTTTIPAGESAIRRYHGPLLDGFHLADAPEFEQWLLLERGRLERLHQQTLAVLLDAFIATNAPARAILIAERLLAADPLSEESHCALMQLYASTGQRDAALRQYERCREILARELSLEPLPATQALYESLRAGKGIGERNQTARGGADIMADKDLFAATTASSSGNALMREGVMGKKVIASMARPPLGVLRSADPAPAHIVKTNLPAPMTTLVGREWEVTAMQALLRQFTVRMVTVSGPGGVGKTRLALHVAHELLDAFAHGAFIVPLASLHDANLVIPSIAQHLGVTARNGQSPMAALKETLAQRAMLLVLDNFEHVTDAALQIADLLAAAPGLKIIVTSRSLLRIYGEREFAVNPLDLPEVASLPPLKQLADVAAVNLFMTRARLVRPMLTLTAENAALIAEICVKLDGLPLALELAAARAKLLSPQAMLERLESRLTLLNRGPQDLPPRQQTLRHTLDWSYDLLTRGAKVLLARLALFVDGWTLEAVDAICVDEGLNAAGLPDALDGLESLAEQSLVQQTAMADGDVRFTMLRTIREYAAEQLLASRDVDVFKRRHANYYLAMARAAEAGMRGPLQKRWLEQLALEAGNLRTALSWALVSDAELALMLSEALTPFWDTRGHVTEGREWLARALELPAAHALPLARGHALNSASVLAQRQGDIALAHAFVDEALELLQAVDDIPGIAHARYLQGTLAYDQAERQQAQAYFTQALELFLQTEDTFMRGRVYNGLGRVAHVLDDYPQATAYFEQALAVFRQVRQPRNMAIALNNLAVLLLEQNDLTRAAELLQESTTLRRDLGDKRGVALTLWNLGSITMRQEDLVQSSHYYQEALLLMQEVGDKKSQAMLLVQLASIAVEKGQFDLVVRLCGASDAILTRIGASRPANQLTQFEQMVNGARTHLSNEAFARAWHDGSIMSLREATALALSI